MLRRFKAGDRDVRWRQVWALVVFSLWHQIFVERVFDPVALGWQASLEGTTDLPAPPGRGGTTSTACGGTTPLHPPITGACAAPRSPPSAVGTAHRAHRPHTVAEVKDLWQRSRGVHSPDRPALWLRLETGG